MTKNNECYIKIPIDCSNNAPNIGENGNWYIGDNDTGIKVHGKVGEPGAQGPAGLQGPAGPQGIQGEPGANGQDADVSRIETLEADVSKLNSDLKPIYSLDNAVTTLLSQNETLYTYTCPSDGFICARIEASAGTVGYVEINSPRVIESVQASTSLVSSACGYFPVSEGDIVTALTGYGRGSGQGVPATAFHFVPSK